MRSARRAIPVPDPSRIGLGDPRDRSLAESCWCGRLCQHLVLPQERRVHQEIVIRIDLPAEVQVAIAIAGQCTEIAAVDAEVVVGIHLAVEVHVAVPTVLHQDGKLVDGLPVKNCVERIATVVGVLNHRQASQQVARRRRVITLTYPLKCVLYPNF